MSRCLQGSPVCRRSMSLWQATRVPPPARLARQRKITHATNLIACSVSCCPSLSLLVGYCFGWRRWRCELGFPVIHVMYACDVKGFCTSPFVRRSQSGWGRRRRGSAGMGGVSLGYSCIVRAGVDMGLSYCCFVAAAAVLCSGVARGSYVRGRSSVSSSFVLLWQLPRHLLSITRQ